MERANDRSTREHLSALAREAMAIAAAESRRPGLPREEAEDCTVAFASQILDVGHRDRWVGLPQSDRGAFLRKCARRFAMDWRRALQRLRAHEAEWPDTVESADEPGGPDPEPGPEHALRAREAIGAIEAAAHRLPDRQHDVWDRYVERGQPIVEIARDLDTTEHAVRQAVYDGALHMRAILRRGGWTLADLRTALDRRAP